MSQAPLPHQDDSLRKTWWRLHETAEHIANIEVNNSEKLEFLKMIYTNLYSELREVHTRQQQVVTWGVTILTGVGFAILALSNALKIGGSIIFSIALALLTLILTKTIDFISEDRMSIARQLDRIHQIIGAFTKDFYAKDTTLFDPIWYGWGFDRNRDSNQRLNQIYKMVIWAIFVADFLILIGKAGVVSFF